MERNDRKLRLIKNVFSLSIVQIANNILPLVTIPYLVRVIGAEKYGAINFVAAIVMYFTLFIQYSFDLTATKRIVADKHNVDERNRIFSEVLYAKLFLFLLASATFTVFVFSLPELSSEKPLAFFSFLYCFSLVFTPNWLFQGMQELDKIAFCNLLSKIIFVIFLFYCVRTKNDYILHPFIYSISAIVVGVISLLYSVIKYKIRLLKFVFSRIVNLLIVERTLFLPIILLNIYASSNLVIIGLLRQNYEVALFSASWKLIVVFQTLIVTPLSLSLFPFIGESFCNSRKAGVHKVRQSFPIVSSVTFAVGVFLWVSAPSIIRIVFGKAFDPSIEILRILCLIPMISSLNNLLGIQTMVQLSLNKLYYRLTLLTACFGIIAGLICTSCFGIVGTAWSWVFTETFGFIVMLVSLYVRKVNVIDLSLFHPKQISETIYPLYMILKKKIINRPG